MAERPLFVPAPHEPELVLELPMQLAWHPGFAASQKAKNVQGLHEAAARAGYTPVLEVSTKSLSKLGQHLSAFHLKVTMRDGRQLPLECAFQGSKVFEQGGPYVDLYDAEVRAAKRDPRLQTSGSLVAFLFEGTTFPLQPKTAFYDWLYLGALYEHRVYLERLYAFAAFTDIEFNPNRSINCQARSCALLVTLMRRKLLDAALVSPEAFVDLLSRYPYGPSDRGERSRLFGG
jgi:hypothetical protein